MLTRRHIRVKVLQSLYAFYNQGNVSVSVQKKFLKKSSDEMFGLYLLMLDMLNALQNQAENLIELSKKKHLPTLEDIKPKRNFVDNRVLKLLASNKSFQEQIEKHKVYNWQTDNEYPQLIFKVIREDATYKEYQSIEHPTFNQDKDFIIYLFKNIIAPNEKLYDYLEDKNLSWVDDFPIVNTAILKLFENLNPNFPDHKWVPKLYKNNDDEAFLEKLFVKVVEENETLINELKGKTPNWDSERIADIDLLVIKMGLTEFLHFPSIPVKVTINEYLEIAKEYSTPKSSIFINGLLDSMSKAYLKDNKLNKSGRGLK